MSKMKTSMAIGNQPLRTVVIAALVIALLGSLHWGKAAVAAPVAQSIQSAEVAGVITGGQSAQIWLGLNPQTPGESVTLVSTWDRNSPVDNGVGFYVLTANQTRDILAGASLGANNLAAGSALSPDSPDNEVGALFDGDAGPYTVVVFNNSNTDANFTLRVDNGVLIDDSGQVRDNLAAADDDTADDADEDADADDAADDASDETLAAAEQTTTTTTTAESDDSADEPVAAATDDTEVASAEQAVVGESNVVRSSVMEGELPNQFDQHFFAFEPDGSNVDVRIVLAFDPQDQPEVARRLNFWVMDEAGFRRYIDPTSSTPPGSVALAAGNTSNSLRANERVAEFVAIGTYVIIVYNNSDIPASYSLTAEGGQFMDDSLQSLTAQRAVSGPATTTAADADDAADDDGAETTTTTTTTTQSTRTGTAGEIYVVQSGDTLSLIARDVLGDIDAWRDICNLNDLADCNRIEVGMELQLPTTAQIGTTEASAPAATTSTTTATATTTTSDDDDAADDEESMADDEEMADEDMADDEAADDADADDADDAADVSEDAVDLIAALRAAGSFDTLVDALEAANLNDALVTGGPFTIFAPTDAAFEALPAGAMEQLMNQPTGQLTQILLFHVLPGRVGSDDISDGMQATTQQGSAVRFELDGSDVLVNGSTVVAPDIEASNGVIHAIDAVILPPTD